MSVSEIRHQHASDDWPLLSISILSYNQKEFLTRSIESVLDQEVNFLCEIIIGDDCSDDGSQELLLDYQRRYPHLIQIVLHPRRYQNEVPGRTNNITNLFSCRGEFTAMLDADDYYCEIDKLQRQVDILRANPLLSMSTHETRIELADSVNTAYQPEYYSNSYGPPIKTGIYDHHSLAKQRFVPFHISSVLFRTALLRPLPAWFWDILAADRVIFYLLTQKGDYHYDERAASVRYYGCNNFTRSPYYTGKSGKLLKLKEVRIFQKFFPATKESPELPAYIGRLHLRLAENLKAEGNWSGAIWNYTKAFFHLRAHITPERVRKVLFGTKTE